VSWVTGAPATGIATSVAKDSGPHADHGSAEHCAVVFDPQGRLTGRATIPAVELRAVDRERVVGVQTDADGVQRIAMHRLTL